MSQLAARRRPDRKGVSIPRTIPYRLHCRRCVMPPDRYDIQIPGTLRKRICRRYHLRRGLRRSSHSIGIARNPAARHQRGNNAHREREKQNDQIISTHRPTRPLGPTFERQLINVSSQWTNSVSSRKPNDATAPRNPINPAQQRVTCSSLGRMTSAIQTRSLRPRTICCSRGSVAVFPVSIANARLSRHSTCVHNVIDATG